MNLSAPPTTATARLGSWAPPRVGKSRRCHVLCDAAGWHYFNFTTAAEGLGSLHGREDNMLPEDGIGWFADLVERERQAIIVIDEIEPLLALWNKERQRIFLRAVTRRESLPCGVVWVARWQPIVDVVRHEILNANRDHLIELDRAN